MLTKRIVIIDAWIAVLLCLVLLGHCSFPNAPNWYVNEVHTGIYCFHMASFFFVCGFLVAHSYRPLHSIQDYWTYIRRRLIKFGVPFLAFGFALCVYHSLMVESSSVAGFTQAIRELFINPISSPSGYLWFIYLLLEFYLIAPIFCQLYRRSIVPGLVLAIILLNYPLPNLYCLQLFSAYLLFFILGIATRMHLEKLHDLESKLKSFSGNTLIFVKVGVIAIWLISLWLYSEKQPLAPALLSIPGMYILAQFLGENSRMAKCCEVLSRHCFTIYLWQMVCIQLWAFVLFRIFQLPHWVLLATVIPVGICGSLLADAIWKRTQCRMVRLFRSAT